MGMTRSDFSLLSTAPSVAKTGAGIGVAGLRCSTLV
jgi:hypothetical protein